MNLLALLRGHENKMLNVSFMASDLQHACDFHWNNNNHKLSTINVYSRHKT